MKKILTSIVFVAIFLILPICVFASGNITVSTSSLTIEEGSSKTFTITATNTIGDVYISSSNTSVATVSTSEWGTGMVEEGQTKSTTVTVRGVSPGYSTITLSLDAATFDGDDLAGQTRTISVQVVASPKEDDSSLTIVVPGGNGNNNNNNNNNNSQKPKDDTKSTNNKLKKLAINGYTVDKVDDHNYKAEVGNGVNEIDVIVEAEDAKAKIEGAGKHSLEVGKNTISITITSESGSKNIITLVVNRSSLASFDDLESVIDTSEDDTIVLDITGGEIVSSNILSKLKESGKTLQLNYQDGNNQYTLIIEGSKLTDFDQVDTGVIFNSNYKKEIDKLAKNTKGIYLSFLQESDFPDGVSLKIPYSDGDKVNIYYYDKDSNKLVLFKKGVQIQNGSVTIPLDKSKDYYLTSSLIGEEKSSKIGLVPILVFVLGILAFVGAIIMFLRNNKKEKEEENVEEPVLTPQPVFIQQATLSTQPPSRGENAPQEAKKTDTEII